MDPCQTLIIGRLRARPRASIRFGILSTSLRASLRPPPHPFPPPCFQPKVHWRYFSLQPIGCERLWIIPWKSVCLLARSHPASLLLASNFFVFLSGLKGREAFGKPRRFECVLSLFFFLLLFFWNRQVLLIERVAWEII